MVPINFFKRNLVAAIVLSASGVALSAPNSFEYSGSITVKNPEVFFNSDIQVFDDTGVISASISESSSGGCSLSISSASTSHAENSLACLIEFRNLPASLSQSENLKVIDVISQVQAYPSLNIEYRLMVKNNADSLVEVLPWTGFELMVDPVLASVVSNISYKTQNDLTFNNTSIESEYDDLKTIQVEVQPRDFAQKIALYLDNVEFDQVVLNANESIASYDVSSLLLEGQYGEIDVSIKANGSFVEIPALEVDTETTYSENLSFNFSMPLSAVIDYSDIVNEKEYSFFPEVTGVKEGVSYSFEFTPTSGISITQGLSEGEILVNVSADIAGRLSVPYTLSTSDGRTFNGIADFSIASIDSIGSFRVPDISSITESDLKGGFSQVSSTISDESDAPLNGIYSMNVHSTGSYDKAVRIKGHTAEVTLNQGASSYGIDVEFIDGKAQLAIRSAEEYEDYISSNLSFEFAGNEHQSFTAKVTLYKMIDELNPLKSEDSYVKGFDKLNIEANSRCSFVENVEDLSHNGEGCHFDFSASTADLLGDMTQARKVLSGFSESAGLKDLSLTVSTKFGDLLVSETFTKNIEVTTPDFNEMFAYNFTLTEINRGDEINKVKIEPAPENTFNCYSYYAETEEDLLQTKDSFIESSRAYCRVVWTSIPAGMSVDPARPMELSGILEDSADKTVSYRIEIDREDGSKHIVDEDSVDLSIIQPASPEIILEPPVGDFIGEFYPYHIDEESIRLTGKAEGNGQLKAHVHDENGDFLSEAYVSSRNSIRYIDGITDKTLGKVTNLTLKMFYAGAPEVFSEKTIKVINLPPAKLKPFIERPSESNNLDLTSFVSKIGLSRFDDSYDASTDGDWDTYLINYSRSNADAGVEYIYEPISSVGKVDSLNTTASLDVMINEPGINRYQVVSEFKDENNNTVAAIKGGISSVFTIQSKEIAGNLVTKRSVGRTPFLSVVSYKPENLQNYRHVASTSWQVGQKDSSGDIVWDTPVISEGKRSLTFSSMFEEPGQYFIKGLVTSDGGYVTETETVSVVAVSNFKVDMTDVKYLMPNTDKLIDFTINGEVPDPDLYEWRWTVGESTYNTATITLAGADVGTRRFVRLKVWDKKAGEDDRLSYIETGKRYTVGYPEKTPVKFEGDKIFYEDDGNTEFSIKGIPRDPGYGLTIESEWEDDKGVITSGDTYLFSPVVDDIGKKVLKYRYWYSGHKDKAVTKNYGIEIKTTKLPGFSFVEYAYGTEAPMLTRLKLVPDRKLDSTELRKLSYSWDLDETQVEAILVRDNYFNGFVKTTNPTDISVTVTSEEGEEKTVSASYDLDGLQLKSMDLRVFRVYEDKILIAALPKIMVRQDTIKSTVVKLNGNIVPSSEITLNGSSMYVNYDNTIENNVIEVSIETEFGYSMTAESNFKSAVK